MRIQLMWVLVGLMVGAGCGGEKSSADQSPAGKSADGNKTAVGPIASDFEGVFRQRMVQVGADATYEVLGDVMYEEPSTIAQSLADLSMEAVLAASDVEAESLVLYVKGSVMRAQPDMEGDPPGYHIIDVAAGTSWMVSVPEKTYIEFTEQTAEDLAAQAAKMMEEMGIDPEEAEEYEAAMEAEAAAAGEPQPMGRSAEINGVQAAAYRYDDDREVVVGWCAVDKTGLMEAMEELAKSSPMSGEEDNVKDWICPDDQMVVRTLRYGHSSGELEVDEILSISRESVPDELFRVPDGFERQVYPGMLGQ